MMNITEEEDVISSHVNVTIIRIGLDKETMIMTGNFKLLPLR